MIRINKSIAGLVIVSIYAAAMLFMAVFNLVKLNKELDEFKVAYIDYSVLKNVDKEPACFNLLNGQDAPIAVIIDNGIGAGMPYGLSQADLVIEAPAEGGVTRFLAFFDQQKLIDKIGPVRSVRPYFIDFAESYGAVLAHAGGSPEALAELSKAGDYNLIDIDEIGPDGHYFWRDPNLSAPHNLFTSRNLLNQAYKNTAYTYNRIESSDCTEAKPFQEKLNLSDPDNVAIDYSIISYEIEYKYDKEKQGYVRYQGGKEFIAAENNQILIDNVLIAFMEVKVADSEGRLKIRTIGEGGAVICNLGQCKDGKWRLPALDKRIRFYYGDESEARLRPGKTWINIVPVGRRVEY
ncbi:MAG: DUF3048 domain-containing protein [Patescibacteria group bacterium]